MRDPVSPTMTPDEQVLVTLARDLHWTWNHSTDVLWRRIDAEVWARTGNPWATLLSAQRSHIRNLLSDAEFRETLAQLEQDRNTESRRATWFQQAHPDSPLTQVAYFSMEYMLDEALPIYSGGLGNVAGDQLKAASDLGVPVIAIGLLYAQGYFRQAITSEGRQEALYPINDPSLLPLEPVLTAEGDWLRMPFRISIGQIWVRVWQATVGRTILYLLDTNDPANPADVRCITTQLYGGDAELRLRQEMVLGIGGWRLLRTLGLEPEVCHLNEGHAAFAALERAHGLMTDLGVSFAHALTIARAGTIFTTHTAVPAGFDRFSPALVKSHLANYAITMLDIPIDDLLALGRADPGNPDEPFNMAWLAIRVSGAVNGVSSLHGAVSRALFTPLFRGWPGAEVPIDHVTNGVHTPAWDSPTADVLWTDAAGKDRWRGTLEGLGDRIRAVDGGTLWESRCRSRERLLDFISSEHMARLCFIGDQGLECLPSPQFSPRTLTMGFARRFATYKRPNLLLHDPERLARLLTHPDHPVQLVLSGKAHPQDRAGQDLIAQWISFSKRPDVSGRVVFLADYDMAVARELVQGVDLWLNTPLRPWEASGTSGMKILVNGGLNLSERDGWWAEAYAPEVGWAIGDGQDHGNDTALDATDADTLYRLLEEEIVPLFYRRNDDDIPVEWVARMRESMARLTPWFSANRSVREYVDRYYVSGAIAYRRRKADQGAEAADVLKWRQRVQADWEQVAFGPVGVSEQDGQRKVTVCLHLGSLPPDMVKVELYADTPGGPPIVVPMTAVEPENPGNPERDYVCVTDISQPAHHYTPRVIPFHAGAWVPLESNLIRWAK